MTPADTPKILFLGAGQQAKLILHILDQQGATYQVVGLLDDNTQLQNKTAHSYPVLGMLKDLPVHAKKASHFAIGIGNIGNPATMQLRYTLYESARKHGLKPISAIHPHSHIDPSATVGEGAVIHPGAIINAFAHIGNSCVLFTNASIDHDCSLGDNVYISPGVAIGGNVTIGSHAFIGIGTSIIQGITIGQDAIIGAGSVVIRNIPAKTTVFGVPARVYKTHDLD